MNTPIRPLPPTTLPGLSPVSQAAPAAQAGGGRRSAETLDFSRWSQSPGSATVRGDLSDPSAPNDSAAVADAIARLLDIA